MGQDRHPVRLDDRRMGDDKPRQTGVGRKDDRDVQLRAACALRRRRTVRCTVRAGICTYSEGFRGKLRAFEAAGERHISKGLQQCIGGQLLSRGRRFIQSERRAAFHQCSGIRGRYAGACQLEQAALPHEVGRQEHVQRGRDDDESQCIRRDDNVRGSQACARDGSDGDMR